MSEAVDGRTRLRTVFWSALLAFFLLAAGWALITPYDGAYDEHDHVVRAAGVVRGQLLVQPIDAQNGRYQNVPRSLVPPEFACAREAQVSARCQGEPPDDRRRESVHTRAGHYNPVFYAVVGWPLAPFPSMTGVILSRLMNALLAAALLALAVVTVWPVRRYRLLLLALLLCVAPIVVSLNGLVNPSGLEISAAVLLWAALGRLLSRPADDDDERTTHRLVLLCGLAAVTLTLLRPAGLVVLVAVIGFAALALAGRATLAGLRRRPDVRRVALVTAVAAVAVVGWSLIANVGSIGTEAPPDERPWTALIRAIVMSRFDYWARQMIGVFGYASVSLPAWTMLVWSAVQGVLVLTGVALARRRHAVAIAAIPVLCLFGGFVVEVATARLIGAFVQGRYFLPIWAGMFVLAALAIPATTLAERVTRRIYGLFTVVWSGAMVLSLYLALRRFKYGQTVDTGATPDPWTPAVGDIVPFVVTALGLALVVWVVRRYLAAYPWPPVEERDEVDDREPAPAA